MYPFLVLAIAIFLSHLMTGIVNQNWTLVQLYQSRLTQQQISSLAENIEQFYIENKSYPTTLTALTATPGFEHAKSQLNNWQSYGVSNWISDSTWTFKRMILVSKAPDKTVTAATYMTSNACGTGSYATATSWCGERTGKWYRSELRDKYNDQVSSQRVHLTRTLQKLTEFYNEGGSFPAVNATGTALAADSLTTLASLASYSGTSTACTGTFKYSGIPIDCADMFDSWGNLIGYQFINSKHIILISEPNIFDNLNNKVIIAADFDNSTL